MSLQVSPSATGTGELLPDGKTMLAADIFQMRWIRIYNSPHLFSSSSASHHDRLCMPPDFGP